MRIAILHNALREEAAPDEIDVMAQVDAVSDALKNLGHDIFILPCDLDLKALKNQILSLSPDLAFNLTESIDGHGRLISVIPFFLSAMGIPYTGSPAEGIHFTSNKLLAKEKMMAAALPTPDWTGVYPEEIHSPSDILLLSPEKKTWIVKSVWEHASLGIDENGLIKNATQEMIFSCLKEKSPYVGGLCFAEEYIDGREFNLSVIGGENGPRILPPAEILFEGYEADKPKIVCYNAKWNEASYEYSHTPRRFNFPSEDKALLEFLENIALRCFRLFRLKGYARVDFRVDREGNPWILEVNANPCLSPDAGFQAAVAQSGASFQEVVALIIDDALRETTVVDRRDALRTVKTDFSKAPSAPLPLPLLSDPFIFRDTPLPSDREIVRELIQKTDFFYAYEVDVAVELVDERLKKGLASGYEFIFLESPSGKVIGYSCYGPIPCTKNSYDIYWIAVDPLFQKQGLGKIIINETEKRIGKQGGKRIYIDTSDSAKYRKTFSFYKNCGYRLVSLLEDFYKDGDGKAVFMKIVSAEGPPIRYSLNCG